MVCGHNKQVEIMLPCHIVVCLEMCSDCDNQIFVFVLGSGFILIVEILPTTYKKFGLVSYYSNIGRKLLKYNVYAGLGGFVASWM